MAPGSSMAAQISHHILPYFAGFALIAFLYVPLYTSLMSMKSEVRNELAAIRSSIQDKIAVSGPRLSCQRASLPGNGTVGSDGDNTDALRSPGSSRTPPSGSDGSEAAKGSGVALASKGAAKETVASGGGTGKRRVLDVNKVMKLCVNEDCMRLLKDTESYTTEVDSAAFERQYCGAEKVLFHMYWDGHMTDRTALILRSYLYTQDLQCTKMILWTMNSTSFLCQNTSSTIPGCNRYDQQASRWKEHVEFRLLDLPGELAKVSRFVGRAINVSYVEARAVDGLDFSDIFRYTILANHGGVYIDADVLLLRDFQVLWEHEFAYRWSGMDNCNTAVFRLKKEGAIARSMIADAIDSGYKFYPLDSCPFATRRNLSLHILPVRLFDPIWLINDDGKRAAPPFMCFRRFREAFEKPCDRLSLDGASRTTGTTTTGRR